MKCTAALFLLALMFGLAGCTGLSTPFQRIAPVYTSPVEYSHLNCADAQTVLSETWDALLEATDKHQKRDDTNAILTAVGGIPWIAALTLGIPLFIASGDRHEAIAIAVLKGRVEALQAHREKEACDAYPLPSLEEALRNKRNDAKAKKREARRLQKELAESGAQPAPSLWTFSKSGEEPHEEPEYHANAYLGERGVMSSANLSCKKGKLEFEFSRGKRLTRFELPKLTYSIDGGKARLASSILRKAGLTMSIQGRYVEDFAISLLGAETLTFTYKGKRGPTRSVLSVRGGRKAITSVLEACGVAVPPAESESS